MVTMFSADLPGGEAGQLDGATRGGPCVSFVAIDRTDIRCFFDLSDI
jgi:hypothetical protein